MPPVQTFSDSLPVVQNKRRPCCDLLRLRLLEKETMTITDKQRLARKTHIGSSDVAAILGFDPFRNAYEVWLDKTGKLDDTQKKGRALNLGTFLEEAILCMSEERLGKIIRGGQRVFKEWPVLMASLDGRVKASNEPVEAKSTNITYRAPDTDQWGEEGTDQVPERIILQCTVQMMVTETQVCHNPVIIGGRGFVMFHIPFDKDLAYMIWERLSNFWTKNVQGDHPPENCTPSMEFIRRIQRQPKSIAPVADELVERWIDARRNRLLLEHVEEDAAAELLAKIGTSEAGQYTGGLISFYEQTRKAYSVPESKFRVMRLQKRKELTDGK
jgi:putative phage-type endonuclease